jgi:NAD(P)-dependent dehydrogenase (short-subunit alcohol dehydrogenase family)
MRRPLLNVDIKSPAGALAAGAAGLWLVRRALRARHRIDFRDRVVVISGGSRGLGLVLARRLANEGARLVLLARTSTDLENARRELVAAGAEVLAVPCDVRDRAGVNNAVALAADRFGRIDALIHVAGVIQFGPLQHMREADFRESLEIHFWGAYYLTEACRPHLPRDGSGRIAYVSSFGGRVAAPHMAAYAAGKFALVGYADAVRTELARDGIRVTTVTPGLMRTGSHVNAEFKGDHPAEYAWFSILDANPLVSTSAESAARQIVNAVRHGDPALTITLRAKMLAALNGLAPGLVGDAMKAANAMLPEPAGPRGDLRRTGWQSFSDASPSVWTRLADDAVAENNELRGHAPPAKSA